MAERNVDAWINTAANNKVLLSLDNDSVAQILSDFSASPDENKPRRFKFNFNGFSLTLYAKEFFVNSREYKEICDRIEKERKNGAIRDFGEIMEKAFAFLSPHEQELIEKHNEVVMELKLQYGIDMSDELYQEIYYETATMMVPGSKEAIMHGEYILDQLLEDSGSDHILRI